MNVNPGRIRPTSTVEGVTETRKLALDLMRKALSLLDEDPTVSPLVGSQLQLAIDRLVALRSRG